MPLWSAACGVRDFPPALCVRHSAFSRCWSCWLCPRLSSGRKFRRQPSSGARGQTGATRATALIAIPCCPADYSDLDCIRVGADYYAISSTFQFSPGVVILHSRDLVNWTIAGHAVADLTQISPDLNWDRMNRYGKGIWAGAIRFHDGRFWVYFGTPDEGYFMTHGEGSPPGRGNRCTPCCARPAGTIAARSGTTTARAILSAPIFATAIKSIFGN